LLFVLAAAAIVVNPIFLAFKAKDPGEFMHLAVAVLLFILGLPAYLFWRKRSTISP
jgi:hypothetical protein